MMMPSHAYERAGEILLVEDNPGDVDLMREGLAESQLPSHLSVVANGEQALAFLRHQGPYADALRPDVILLDLNLPRKNGHEVLADIKVDDALRRIPVIIFTSSHHEADIFRSYALQANCYIIKPLDLERFLHTIRALIEFWFTVATLPSLPIRSRG